MSPLTRTTKAAVLGLLAPAALLATLTACGGPSADGGQDAAPEPRPTATAAAQVTFPAPRTAPPAAPTLTPAPTKGEVRVEQGPFTDRVRLTRLALASAAAEPRVTGHLAITSDVSDVLALELRAAYYDEHGRLLGTGSFQYQEEGEDAHGTERHDGPRAAGDGIDFTVPAKGLTGTPVAAVVSVPVLVNE
ncbi:hypothetical protein ACIRSU_20130 [Streptomyces sp. NPDC101160]|uniref:hypothetical protein n=1 Tax=Streptomyces sp. NPDC101160 TaxID=3366118 RepID=UPI0037F3602F